jgi:hypothetical protein
VVGGNMGGLGVVGGGEEDGGRGKEGVLQRRSVLEYPGLMQCLSQVLLEGSPPAQACACKIGGILRESVCLCVCLCVCVCVCVCVCLCACKIGGI